MPRLIPALVAEAVGVFALSFIGILAIQQGSAGGLVGVALAHGLILGVAITAAAAVSGGHINPAVTVGFLVAGKIKPGPAIAYIIAQLAGGFLAGLAVIALTPANGISTGAGVVAGGTPTVNFGLVTMGGAFIAETITTFFLMMAVWGTAVDPRAPKIGGFGVGLTVTADILAIGPMTGAAMNPARAIGPALAATLFGAPATWTNPWWAHHWVYWLGPITGAVIATLLYKFFFSPEVSS